MKRIERQATVMITGIAGFLGTHVAKHFVDKGWKVLGIDNLTDFELSHTKYDVEASRKHNVDFLSDIGAKLLLKDIRTVTSADMLGVDYIIHCAAQPAMTLAIKDPALDMATNVIGTFNMLSIARDLNIPVANCSSVHVYGNDSNESLTEGEDAFVGSMTNEDAPILIGDVTPLHASKRAAEIYAQTFAETYGIRVANFRLTGMYGERQFGGMDHGWVANFTIQTLMEEDITVFGTDKQVRDILYAGDAARAFELWYENGEAGTYNIGGGESNAISIKQVLSELNRITEVKQNITVDEERFGDMWYFVCDSTKALEFGWSSEISPEEGLPKLVDWVKENKQLFKKEEK